MIIKSELSCFLFNIKTIDITETSTTISRQLRMKCEGIKLSRQVKTENEKKNLPKEHENNFFLGFYLKYST